MPRCGVRIVVLSDRRWIDSMESAAMCGYQLSAASPPLMRILSPWLYDASVKRALVLLCAFYGSTIVALYWIGIRPVVPWSLLPVLVLVVIPFALGAAGAASLVAGHAASGHAMTRLGCM